MPQLTMQNEPTYVYCTDKLTYAPALDILNKMPLCHLKFAFNLC